MTHYSPLRYPGGKNRLSAFIAKLCIDNNVNNHYVEPYSGGASVALFLLMENFVSKITINDKDRSIYAFWFSVLNDTENFCDLIINSEISIEEWKKQKNVQLEKDKVSLLELGFSTFYLNRTNRSGIINAGVIGGLKQDGDYLMDCRFNKNDLISRIKKIAERKSDINLYNLDAIELIEFIKHENINNQNLIFYFDPPYFFKANSLYMNHYDVSNHLEVSEKIKSLDNYKWIVSYDNVKEIKELYKGISRKQYSFKHTAHTMKDGKEILFFSRNLKKPKIKNWNPTNFKVNKKREIYYKDI